MTWFDKMINWPSTFIKIESQQNKIYRKQVFLINIFVKVNSNLLCTIKNVQTEPISHTFATKCIFLKFRFKFEKKIGFRSFNDIDNLVKNRLEISC